MKATFPSPPRTGNELMMAAVVIHRIEDGKLAEKWSSKDELALLQQLEILP